MLRGLRNAWLSPAGEVVVDHEDFAPMGAWHEELAVCIVRDLLNFEPSKSAYTVTEKVRSMNGGFAYVYEYLESIRWVRLCGWQLKVKWVIPDGLVFPAQRRIIEAWCKANDTTWDKAVDRC